MQASKVNSVSPVSTRRSSDFKSEALRHCQNETCSKGNIFEINELTS